MRDHFFTVFSRLPSGLRGFVYKHFYQFMAGTYRRQDWKFMNYGFAPLSGQDSRLNLDAKDEENRLYIQLYNHLASSLDLEGLDVLEVGCGRGGGAEFIARYLHPSRMVGLDLSRNVIEFCTQVYDLDGLSFETGDAQALPFVEESFDVLINVESSHCYGCMGDFLGEVHRVLRRGGTFLLADFRRVEALDELRSTLLGSGLTLVEEKDITPNILKALDMDHPRRTSFIKDTVPRPLIGLAHQFAGTSGTTINKRLRMGETVYSSFVMRKMAD
ncbi:MAG: class I SAM-dependent methyltransferase [Anaerolineales bacterium]